MSGLGFLGCIGLWIDLVMKAMKSDIIMKAILILALALGIQFSSLMAGTNGNNGIPPETNNLFCPECIVLIPTVPMEASFTNR